MMPNASSASAGYGMPGLTGEMPLRSIEADDPTAEGGEHSYLYSDAKGEEEEDEEGEGDENRTPYKCKMEEEEEPAAAILRHQAMNPGMSTGILTDTKNMGMNMGMGMGMGMNTTWEWGWV